MNNMMKYLVVSSIFMVTNACSPKVYVIDRQSSLEEQAAGRWPEIEKRLIKKGLNPLTTPLSPTPASDNQKRLYEVLQGEMLSSPTAAPTPTPSTAAPPAPTPPPAPSPTTSSAPQMPSAKPSAKQDGFQRMIPLEKMTVGPDDQYDVTLNSSGEYLIFTHKADLIPSLQVQSIKTQVVYNLLPPQADAQDPAWSHEGQLAFTSFLRQARGDICYTNISLKSLRQDKKPSEALITEKDIHCLPRRPEQSSHRRSDPFWKSPNELGFLQREFQNDHAEIIIYNIEKHTESVLAQGLIWAPSMAENGNFLAYNQEDPTTKVNDKTKTLILLDLLSQKQWRLDLPLPGFSSFPRFSDDGHYLFLSHYLNDTNHDNTLDAQDTSVIVRVPLSAENLSHLEQFDILTSPDSNCNLPSWHPNWLYVTCAYQGSLDIYRLPSTGIVPTHWDAPKIENAIATSRSYGNRILLLHALQQKGRHPQSEIVDRLLSQHWLSGDIDAARFYIDRLQKIYSTSKSKQRLYKLLDTWLLADKIRSYNTNTNKNAPLPPDIEKELLKLLTQTQTHAQAQNQNENTWPYLSLLLRSHIQTLLGRKQQAINTWITAEQTKQSIKKQKVASSSSHSAPFSSPLPIELFLSSNLAQSFWSISDLLTTAHNKAEDLRWPLQSLREMLTSPVLSSEVHLASTFRFLSQLQQNPKISRAQRISFLDNFKKDLPQDVQALIDSEIITLQLIESKEESSKIKIYQKLGKLMGETRNNYFLRKSLSIRSLQNLITASEFRFMEFVATNWLRYTDLNDTEYIHAREVVTSLALDKGYNQMRKNNFDTATGFFFGSLSATDDLESHALYLHTKGKKSTPEQIKEIYNNLKQQNMISDNMNFVEALLDLQNIDRGIELIEAMTQERQNPMRYLVLGSLELEKFLREANGPDYDENFYQKLHHDLILALDLGRDNIRIRASSLMKLGILHWRVQNYAWATRFFELREQIGFQDPEEHLAWSWWMASCLSHTQSWKRAERILQTAENEILPLLNKDFPTPMIEQIRTALRERQSFYILSAEQSSMSPSTQTPTATLENDKKALALLPAVLPPTSPQSTFNQVVFDLRRGYHNFKLKDQQTARVSLRRALQLNSQLKPDRSSSSALLAYEPELTAITAYGLLSQIESTPEAKLEALMQRTSLIRKKPQLIDQPEVSLIRHHLQCVDLGEQAHRPVSEIQTCLIQALQTAQDWAKLNSPRSLNIYQALTESISWTLIHINYVNNKIVQQLQPLLLQTLQSFDNNAELPGPLLRQKLKLQILAEAFRRKISSIAPKESAEIEQSAKQQLVTSPEALLERKDYAALRDESAEAALQLMDLAGAILIN